MLLGATDVAPSKAQADVTADLLARIGANVDYQAMDWGTMDGPARQHEAALRGRVEHLPYLVGRRGRLLSGDLSAYLL